MTNKNASDGDIKKVKYVRTDSNGNYVIKNHPDADGTSQEWHVAPYYADGTGEFNAPSKPSVDAKVGTPIPNSGVARWTFDTADISGSTAKDVWDGHDATITGATTGVSGLATTYNSGEGISYDGQDDITEEDGIAWDASSQDITWALWIKLDNTNSGQILNHEDGTNNRFALFWDGSVVSAMVYNGSSTVGQATSVSTGSAVHLVAAYDSSAHAVDFYVDGSSVTGSIPGARFKGGVTGIAMAARIGGSEHLSCDQDDVRIYNKLLSSSEASNLYNNGAI